MIREYSKTEKELDALMEIWLETNLSAHPFVEEDYWRGQKENVRKMLPEAELLVFEEGGIIKGFMGVWEQEYIAGIFVAHPYQSQGVGSQLVKAAKSRYPKLTLDVYTENQQAVGFYKKEGFQTLTEKIDEDTGQQEQHMVWKK